ncbi:MAG: inositol monophosphatase [Chloroflexi bacterium]|nr:inositol monophosphatase [Chloroflexota bacterium]
MDRIVGTSGKTAMEVAREAAIKAGTILIERFSQIKEVSFKGRGNVVTDVDLEVEREIFAVLGREFPSMGLLGEESEGVRPDSGYAWIVDPLDGTRNYVSGIPFFSVVVGLALDGEVLVGVNYDPIRDEMFHAERGKGAFLNDEPIRVSQKTSIEECILGMDMSYNDEGASNGLNAIVSLWPGMQTVRIMGSAALGIAYAAAGRHDLYFHHQLEPWDQVAGLLLVEEAGGVITDRSGKRAGLHSDGLIASSKALHVEFMRKTEGMPWRRPTQGLV